MIGTATEIELLRAGAILLGALASLLITLDVLCDWRALRLARQNGVLRLVIIRNVRAEAMRLLVQLLLLGPSVLALFMPSSQSMLTLPSGIVGQLWIPANTWGSTAASVVLCVWAVWAWWDRRALMSAIREKEGYSK
jgi:hypothetical protein